MGTSTTSSYTLQELEEALASINVQMYPKNLANLRSAYERLTATIQPPSTSTAPAVDVLEVELPEPRYDANGRYIPNEIPKGERGISTLLSLLLLAYGSYGIWSNDLYLPGKRSRGVHLHDSPAWVMYGAVLCACLVMLSVVVDHYDRRNNERSYRVFANALKVIGWTLFGLSLLLDFSRQARG